MIAILFGCFFSMIGFLALRSHYQFFKTAIIVPGAIIGFKSYQHKNRENGRETTMYHTVASFEFDGQMREIVSKSSSSLKPKIGKIVKIAVNPMDIKEAYIYSQVDVFVKWLVLITGVLFMWLGIMDVCSNF